MLQHGILGSALDWIIGPDAPAYFLAQRWYDVWLGNNRGNIFSLEHNEYDHTKNAEYWNFTFEEMGHYDSLTEVDYIRDLTSQDKITYIGHSQGNT